MTINLHRITMHVSIKKTSARNGKATILHSGIPCPDKTYSANSRGDARQEAGRPGPRAAARRGYIWIIRVEEWKRIGTRRGIKTVGGARRLQLRES